MGMISDFGEEAKYQRTMNEAYAKAEGFWAKNPIKRDNHKPTHQIKTQYDMILDYLNEGLMSNKLTQEQYNLFLRSEMLACKWIYENKGFDLNNIDNNV